MGRNIDAFKNFEASESFVKISDFYDGGRIGQFWPTYVCLVAPVTRRQIEGDCNSDLIFRRRRGRDVKVGLAGNGNKGFEAQNVTAILRKVADSAFYGGK